ncbi:MAG: hypothetical protein AAGK04_14630, partial [Planctomycetota bacterium]
GWSEPEALGGGVNSELHDVSPAIAPDGHTLYLASNRLALGEAEVDPRAGAERFKRDLDLYRVDLSGEALVAARVESLSTPYHDTDPAISPGGDFIYFASDRPVSEDDAAVRALDLYRARLGEDGPRPPERLGDEINTPAHEAAPSIGMDGFELRFASNREGRGDLYRSVSREVYADVLVARPSIDWAELWKRIWPWLLMLVIASLLLWWLSRLLRETRWVGVWRTLGLMTWCALLSAVVHALLALLFTVLEVTATPDDRGDGGARRVIVASSVGGGGGVASQVRASLTDASAAAAPTSVAPAELSEASSATSSIVDASEPLRATETSMASSEAMRDAASAPTASSASRSIEEPAASASAASGASESDAIRTPAPTPAVAAGDAESNATIASAASGGGGALTATPSGRATSESGPVAGEALVASEQAATDAMGDSMGGLPASAPGASGSSSAMEAALAESMLPSLAMGEGSGEALRTPEAGGGDAGATDAGVAARLVDGSASGDRWDGGADGGASGSPAPMDGPSIAVAEQSESSGIGI